MTNKKFKVAAMSMALTACVAAQPLIANAEEGVSAVSNGTTGSTSQSEEESSTGSGTESKSSEGSSTRCCCQCVVRSGDQPAERGRCGCDRRPGYQRGL